MSMTATRSTPGMMHATLNFRAVVPMLGLMNASAQVTAANQSPELDNRRVARGLVDLASSAPALTWSCSPATRSRASARARSPP